VQSAFAAVSAGNPLGGPPLELNHESNHLHRRLRRHRLVHCRVFRPALRAEQGRTRRCCAVTLQTLIGEIELKQVGRGSLDGVAPG
jgi:hypothetical protein